MSTIQNTDARRLLDLLQSVPTDIDYRRAAEALGRDPETDSRAVAQICDLLDAAAALAGVPLLALVKVRTQTGDINPKAWTSKEEERELRPHIIARSEGHKFTPSDFDAIREALKKLVGRGNKAAWTFVRTTVPDVNRWVAFGPQPAGDAIQDFGVEYPTRKPATVYAYDRNPKVRAAVLTRAQGRCEYCGALGFLLPDGGRYLESHHIIALASHGKDTMSNVIALCANDHREVHFGERSEQMESEMTAKVRALTKT